MKSTKTPANQCLLCQTPLSAATNLFEDVKPHAGTLSVCYQCGGVSMFADDLTLRPMTDEEIAGVKASPQAMLMLQRMVAAVHFVRAERERRN